jgi:hypothetical protein
LTANVRERREAAIMERRSATSTATSPAIRLAE